MFLHLTDTTAKIKGDFSVKQLIGEGRHMSSLYSYAYPEQKDQWEQLYRMQIHLADTSSDRGQYQALIDLDQNNHLASYAYKNAHSFDKVWEEQTEEMRLFLAGHSATKETESARKEHEQHLTTFADRQEVANLLATVIDKKKLPRILIDSGAFTAFTTGKKIRLEEYVEWCLEFKQKWEPLVRSLHFFNLDVIGDEEKSDENLAKCERMGLNPIPVFTYQGDVKFLKKYLDYPYLSFGGLVGKTTKRQTEWLDYCFKFVSEYRRKNGRLPKIHLLGVTKQPLLERYPVYSCDSSSWVKCLRFGGGEAIGKKKIPRYNESEQALKITIATLRAEIKKYQQMEKEVTDLWAKRGIIWED